jgi:dephospho-CoA kinase
MKKSRAVVILPYQPAWVVEFTRIARRIRNLVGHAAIRIDHIGSTAVPGLAGKRVRPVQGKGSGLHKCISLQFHSV